MNFFSQAYDFMFAPGGTSDSDSGRMDTTNDSNVEQEPMIINPVDGMPMIGGMGGLDVLGNPYGVDLHHDESIGMDHSGMFSHDDCGSMFDDNSTTCDSSSMFDSTSSIDSSSMFDSSSSTDNNSMFD